MIKKNEIYIEYKKIQEELFKEYQKVRDEFINGYLTRKVQISYEELKLVKKSIRDKYMEKRRKVLEKYLNDESAN
jgi:hypothetical protein